MVSFPHQLHYIVSEDWILKKKYEWFIDEKLMYDVLYVGMAIAGAGQKLFNGKIDAMKTIT